MADKFNQDVELDDNEDIDEAHDPKNAEKQSIASVSAAAGATKKAPARKGDKSNSEPMTKNKANMISVAHDLMSEMTEEELEDMIDMVMESDEEYDEEEDLDEAALSPEKKKAMKLAYQVGQHGTMRRYGVTSDVSSRHYKGDDVRNTTGRHKAAADHLAKTKGTGTSGAFDKAAKAARKSTSDNILGRDQKERERAGADKRQGPPDERAGYTGVKGPASVKVKQMQYDRKKAGPKRYGSNNITGPSKRLPEDYEIDYTDLNALVESEATLSEEFKAKTAVIFEAAVKSALSEEIDRLEEAYVAELEEETAAMRAEMVEKVDSYLNYVVESWMEENKLAVQAGLRTEIAETFMSKLKDLFTESYIEVPESKVDLVDELTQANEELEEQLNSTVAKSIELAEQLEFYKRNDIIREAAKDLAETQVAKLKSLVEDIDFDDEGSFTQKVKTIKESYFKKKTAESAIIDDEDNSLEEEVSPVMAQYLKAIRKSH